MKVLLQNALQFLLAQIFEADGIEQFQVVILSLCPVATQIEKDSPQDVIVLRFGPSVPTYTLPETRYTVIEFSAYRGDLLIIQ